MTFRTLGTRARMLSWAATAMIALEACSAAATPTPATAAPVTAAPVTAAPATAAPTTSAAATAAPSASPSEATSSGTYTLTVVNGPAALGKYMAGEAGKTLYTFKHDTPGDGKSACSGTCATNWPPFTLDTGEKAIAGAGAAGKIATITRADGKAQVTYNGAPLYYFAGDSAAGDTNGQGSNGIWFVAAP